MFKVDEKDIVSGKLIMDAVISTNINYIYSSSGIMKSLVEYTHICVLATFKPVLS